MPRTLLPPVQVTDLSILDPDGHADPDLDPGLGADTLLGMYRTMTLSRELDTKMLAMQRQGRMGTFPPTTGQEAVAVPSAMALGPADWVAPTYRELGARLVRGEPILDSLVYYGGFEEGSRIPVERRVLPYQVVLGTQVPHAVGIAYAMKLKGEVSAVLVYFGDGASSEGDVHEAMNFAGAWKAPVVFVCVNNQWAISTPLHKQTATSSFALRAAGYGFDGVRVDGNDALAMYVATRDALEKARAGGGPTLIEARTFRLMMHTTADDPTKYRDEALTKEAWAREPLPRLRRYLQDRGLLDDARQEALLREVREEVEAAVRAFETPTPRKPDAPFDHVFHTREPLLERQRQEFLAALGNVEGKEASHA